jgi:hypothetical protein
MPGGNERLSKRRGLHLHSLAAFLDLESISWRGDIRQLVLESFWAHHKDIPISAGPKINNTELFLRYLKKIYADTFQ